MGIMHKGEAIAEVSCICFRTGHAFAEGFEPEVAAVHLAQPAGKLVEMPGPTEAERENIEHYRASVSAAHQLNIDALQTVITQRAAESDDVNYLLVRRAAE